MRKVVVALVALVLVAGLGAPAEAASKKFKVSIKVSSSTIYRGQTVTISGKVSPRAAGQKVVIQKKTSTSSSWKSEARVKIRSNGTYSFTDRPTSLKWRTYRVYKPKKGKRKAGYSKSKKVVVKAAPKPVRRPAEVTIVSAGRTTIDAGQQFVLSGKASANLRGKGVRLQIKDGSSWSSLSGATVLADGTFVLKANATRAGRGQQIRAYAPATATTLAAGSAVKVFTVYGWYYLSDREPVEGYVSPGAVSISGTTHARSISQAAYLNDLDTVQFDLARKCTRMVATAGVTDSADSGTLYSVSVRADDVQRWARVNAGLGSPSSVDVDLTGALRLILEATRTSRGKEGSFGYGNARIRCAF